MGTGVPGPKPRAATGRYGVPPGAAGDRRRQSQCPPRDDDEEVRSPSRNIERASGGAKRDQSTEVEGRERTEVTAQ
jgi:hypothetical protein